MDAFLGKLPTWAGEANDLATEANTNASNASTSASNAASSASDAQDYKNAAQAFANYEGDWSGLTGALTVPASVHHDSKFWILNTDLADVTASEPSSTNSDWSVSGGEIATLDDEQTLSNKTLTDPEIDGCILEEIYTITDGAAFEIDPSNGSMQLITLGASRTPKATNFANGEAILLMVDDGTAYTLTWTDTTFGTSGVVWKTDGGSAPELNLTGYTAVALWKIGNQVYGARVGDS
jgi:hypothetical protein